MGNIMKFLVFLFRPQSHSAGQERTQRAEEIEQLTRDVPTEVAQLRHRIGEMSSAEDPLAELMRTLRPKKSRSGRQGNA